MENIIIDFTFHVLHFINRYVFYLFFNNLPKEKRKSIEKYLINN